MSDREEDLPFEQAKNTEYMKLLKEWLEKPAEYGVSRSQKWVKPQPHAGGKTYDVMEPLIGRVGLASEDELLGNNFYIGARHIEKGDLRVFSWAAPIARLFFELEGSDDLLHEEVAIRRTFTHLVENISGLDDEWVKLVDVSPFAAPELSVPPPTRPPTRVRGPDDASVPAERQPQELHPQRDGQEPAEDDPALRGMRAKDAVLRRMRAPRVDKLGSVLSTLQPDQFDLVSRPADDSILVQGHPGTGKTVVAAYRATYLSAERDDGPPRARRLLLVGPSAQYVQHVEGLVRSLDGDARVGVTHLEAILTEVTGLNHSWSGGIGGEHDDVDAAARGLADVAVRMLRGSNELKQGRNATKGNIEAIYELIRSNGRPGQPLTGDPERIAWTNKLPPFGQISRLRRYLPLLAQCRVAYQPVPFADKVDHIIVDEAQDVSPIEWNVLEQLLTPTGNWTLFGDMNQRRSDVTYGSWQEIADHLGIGDGDADCQVSVMSRGYRSTKAILDFAAKLLPREQRGHQSIQRDGVPVRVERCGASEVARSAARVARQLGRAHPDGTVAIITVDPAAIIQELGRGGWRRDGDMHHWRSGDRQLQLYVPEDARGLEFDAVVVVEPIDFPENLGRAGQLYTSLTRANRELAVVWSRAMPDALRRASRT
jgi:DNA helicase-2/ATP-dependent DNA helicase PcrA